VIVALAIPRTRVGEGAAAGAASAAAAKSPLRNDRRENRPSPLDHWMRDTSLTRSLLRR
jgi:hypothetical protein